MALSFRDEQGNISSWVWLAVGAVIFVVVFILFRGSGGASASNPQVTDTGTSDITGQLANLEQEILALQQGLSHVPKDTGKPKKQNPTNPIPGSITLNIRRGTHFFDRIFNRNATGTFAGSQHVLAILVKQTKDFKWFRILSGNQAGEFVKIPIPDIPHKKPKPPDHRPPDHVPPHLPPHKHPHVPPYLPPHKHHPQNRV